jgi:hypothetical protein
MAVSLRRRAAPFTAQPQADPPHPLLSVEDGIGVVSIEGPILGKRDLSVVRSDEGAASLPPRYRGRGTAEIVHFRWLPDGDANKLQIHCIHGGHSPPSLEWSVGNRVGALATRARDAARRFGGLGRRRKVELEHQKRTGSTGTSVSAGGAAH